MSRAASSLTIKGRSSSSADRLRVIVSTHRMISSMIEMRMFRFRCRMCGSTSGIMLRYPTARMRRPMTFMTACRITILLSDSFSTSAGTIASMDERTRDPAACTTASTIWIAVIETLKLESSSTDASIARSEYRCGTTTAASGSESVSDSTSSSELARICHELDIARPST